MSDALRAAAAEIEAGARYRAVSSLYYAVFHLARLLLLGAGLEPKTHAGTGSLLHAHFGEVLPRRALRAFADLAHRRLVADYDAVVELEEGDVEEALAAARTFVTAVLPHLEGEFRERIEVDLEALPRSGN